MDERQFKLRPKQFVSPYLLTGIRRKIFTIQTFRPAEAKLVHYGLASGAGLLALSSARSPRISRLALGNVDGAQEGLELWRALDLDQREELVHLQACFILRGMAQSVGHDRLAVPEVFAQRNYDGLTCSGWISRRGRWLLLSLKAYKNRLDC